MNGKELLGKLELVEPKYIDAADKVPRKKPIKWQQWTSLAACLVLALVAGICVIFGPDNGTSIEVADPNTASIFSSGGLPLILLASSLLGALGIAAYIINDRKK